MNTPKIEIVDRPVLTINDDLTATLARPYRFVVNGEYFTIPEGEDTDYASYFEKPRLLSWVSRKIVWSIFVPVSEIIHAVLIHDHLLGVRIPAEIADRWFKAAMKATPKVSKLKELLGYYTVRLYDKLIRSKK